MTKYYSERLLLIKAFIRLILLSKDLENKNQDIIKQIELIQTILEDFNRDFSTQENELITNVMERLVSILERLINDNFDINIYNENLKFALDVAKSFQNSLCILRTKHYWRSDADENIENEIISHFDCIIETLEKDGIDKLDLHIKSFINIV